MSIARLLHHAVLGSAIATFILCLPFSSAHAATESQTAHSGNYRFPAVHGNTVVFTTEGDLWSVDIHGGVPQRRTWDGESAPVGWANDGRLLIHTLRYSTLPDAKLVLLDNRGGHETLPLAEGSEAAYSVDGRSLFFTRYQ